MPTTRSSPCLLASRRSIIHVGGNQQLGQENGIPLISSSLLDAIGDIYLFVHRSRIRDKRNGEEGGDTSHRFNKVAEQRTVYVEGGGEREGGEREGVGSLQNLFLKIETALIEKL